MLSGIAFLQVNKITCFISSLVASPPVELKMDKAGASDDLTEADLPRQP